ncbi:MAG: hypothetical protein DRQ46_08360 [Gammaproteobacteria bacterium]|nr:MAG: hypothetical protein DRQ46_08360 [Gammaproteobacteria bacterium]
MVKRYFGSEGVGSWLVGWGIHDCELRQEINIDLLKMGLLLHALSHMEKKVFPENDKRYFDN